MSNKTDVEYKIVRQLKILSETLDKKFEADGKRLKKAELNLKELNSDKKIDLALELIKTVFKEVSFLDIKQIAYFDEKENKNITWKEVLDNLESHAKY